MFPDKCINTGSCVFLHLTGRTSGHFLTLPSFTPVQTLLPCLPVKEKFVMRSAGDYRITRPRLYKETHDCIKVCRASQSRGVWMSAKCDIPDISLYIIASALRKKTCLHNTFFTWTLKPATGNAGPSRIKKKQCKTSYTILQLSGKWSVFFLILWSKTFVEVGTLCTTEQLWPGGSRLLPLGILIILAIHLSEVHLHWDLTSGHYSVPYLSVLRLLQVWQRLQPFPQINYQSKVAIRWNANPKL